MKKLIKITSILIIQAIVFSSICFTSQAQACLHDGHSMLSPAIHIPDQMMQSFFMQPEFIKRPPRLVEVILKSKEFKNDTYIGEIKIQFEHDRSGILHDILHKIKPKTYLSWLSMSKDKGINTMRFGIKSNNAEEIDNAEARLKEIKDKKPAYKKEMREEKYVLKLDLRYYMDDLTIITLILKNKKINVSRFLTPEIVEKGFSRFAFELEIPVDVDIEKLEKELENRVKRIGGRKKLYQRTLIDELLEEYLFKDLKIEKTKEIRESLEKALKVVAHRISMPRKDMKTPFLMHPIEVIHVLVNKMKIFTSRIISYLTKELEITEKKRITKEQLIIDILIAALLHDAIEDGDITERELRTKFNNRVADIVLMLTRDEIKKTKEGETIYLKNLRKRTGAIGLIAQLIKIADRMHNLNSLRYNKKKFQRKTFFSTRDTFIPEFIDKIDFESIGNKNLRKIFEKAVNAFEGNMLKIGKKLGFLDAEGKEIEQQRALYESEEKIRQNNIMLLMVGKEIKKTIRQVDSILKEDTKKSIRIKEIITKPIYSIEGAI